MVQVNGSMLWTKSQVFRFPRNSSQTIFCLTAHQKQTRKCSTMSNSFSFYKTKELRVKVERWILVRKEFLKEKIIGWGRSKKNVGQQNFGENYFLIRRNFCSYKILLGKKIMLGGVRKKIRLTKILLRKNLWLEEKN